MLIILWLSRICFVAFVVLSVWNVEHMRIQTSESSGRIGSQGSCDLGAFVLPATAWQQVAASLVNSSFFPEDDSSRLHRSDKIELRLGQEWSTLPEFLTELFRPSHKDIQRHPHAIDIYWPSMQTDFDLPYIALAALAPDRSFSCHASTVFGDIMSNSRSLVWWTWKAPCRKGDTTSVTRCFQISVVQGILISQSHQSSAERAQQQAVMRLLVCSDPLSEHLATWQTEHLPWNSTTFLLTSIFHQTSMHSSHTTLHRWLSFSLSSWGRRSLGSIWPRKVLAKLAAAKILSHWFGLRHSRISRILWYPLASIGINWYPLVSIDNRWTVKVDSFMIPSNMCLVLAHSTSTVPQWKLMPFPH